MHPYRQHAGPDESAVDDYEAGLRRLWRRALRRLIVVGVLVLLAGLAVLIYGRHLESLQEASAIQFVLPKLFFLSGAIGAGLGVILLLVALLLRLRARRL